MVRNEFGVLVFIGVVKAVNRINAGLVAKGAAAGVDHKTDLVFV